ncbi:hypothetical protein [Bacillus sp. JJ1562]|uniref:hypothetical protein n=1 Tax=Bacillus sp. JJ1562 TaxID=3122960 RepID=UPI0030027440
MLVLALVLGGLMIYFLTPLTREMDRNFKKYSNKSLSVALKNSFIFTTVHKKAIFALLLVTVSLVAIWWSHLDIESYNIAHGGETLIDPTKQAITYMIGAASYALGIYLFLIIKRTIKIIKSK